MLAPLSEFFTGSLSAVICQLSDAVWAANPSPLAALGLKMSRCVLRGELMLKDSKWQMFLEIAFYQTNGIVGRVWGGCSFIKYSLSNSEWLCACHQEYRDDTYFLVLYHCQLRSRHCLRLRKDVQLRPTVMKLCEEISVVIWLKYLYSFLQVM